MRVGNSRGKLSARAIREPIRIDREAAVYAVKIGAVGGDEPGVHELRPSRDRQQALLQRELRNLRGPRDHARVPKDNDALDALLTNPVECIFRILAGQNLDVLGLHTQVLGGATLHRAKNAL
jgi:acyl-CoA hydrolase